MDESGRPHGLTRRASAKNEYQVTIGIKTERVCSQCQSGSPDLGDELGESDIVCAQNQTGRAISILCKWQTVSERYLLVLNS